MRVFSGIEELQSAVGEHLGYSDWLTVDQERIDAFADATGDHQWIHVDPERAAAGPFGGPVAHGFLTLSLVPFLNSKLREVEGVKMGVNYGMNKVRFPAPVRVGARVRARSTIVEVDEVAPDVLQLVSRITIEIEGSDKPACVADMVSRYYFS